MIDIERFKTLVGAKIRRVFVIVWPPLHEEKMLDVDMSVGFDLEEKDGSIVQIAIDKDDNWTPLISSVEVLKVFEWEFFKSRLEGWMSGELDGLMRHEYYEASRETLFNNITSSEVLDIEFLTLKGKFNPFGVKLIFADDYIILSSTSDGSTFETSRFNQLGNIENFQKMGGIEYVKLAMVEHVSSTPESKGSE